MNFKSFALAAILAGTALAAAAEPVGPDLVFNGGFDTPNTPPDAGWTIGGEYTFVNVGNNSGKYAGFTPFGEHALFSGCIGDTCGTASQTISTIAGQYYWFSFEYGNSGTTPNAFTASFDGHEIFSVTDDSIDINAEPQVGNDPQFFYIHKSFLVKANSTSTVINFAIRNDEWYQSVDDISVIADNTVPEPGSLALLGLGLAGFSFLRRKAK